MNPNDLIAQQQMIANQYLQHYQHVVWGLFALKIVALVITGWVIYMFYARLRDIGDELRKFRIAFEMADNRKTQSAAPAPPRADDDSRYLPKS